MTVVNISFMRKLLNIFFTIITIASLVFVGWYIYNNYFSNNLNQAIDQIRNENIFTPEPLQYDEGTQNSYLTRAGIIKWTNKQREINGLEPLSETSLLGQSAKIKAEDMLENEYFAHEAPNGDGVAELASEVGYSYIIIGENLAMGNFEDDQVLVQAWMDSPGHRANILKEEYTQIGVGIKEGIYKGESVWMAVQHFGTPQTVCQAPDSSLKSDIESNNQTLTELKDEIDKLEKRMDQADSRQEYNEIRQEYKEFVSRYNNLIADNKELSSQYNSQASDYNSCLNSYK
jgi:uncharacterized protein YkwD